MRTTRGFLFVATLVSGALLSASAALATTISIGLQESGTNGGAITTVATGSNSASFSGAYGTFSFNSIDGAGNNAVNFPDILYSNSINTSTASAGTINVFVTSQGNTLGTGVENWISSFTSNRLPAGWSVTEKTFLDTANGQYALTTALGSASLAALETDIMSLVADAGGGPYSVTEEFTISAVGSGTANDTIDLSVAVPEPASLTLFGVALLGLGLFGWRRKRA